MVKFKLGIQKNFYYAYTLYFIYIVYILYMNIQLPTSDKIRSNLRYILWKINNDNIIIKMNILS